jgi:superfamily II DNA or RNA helicase
MTEATLTRLRPHQQAPAQHLLDLYRRSGKAAVDFSDMGTGKTYVACAVAHELGWPTLVVAPYVALTAWERAAKQFNDKFSLINYEMLSTGRTPFGHWENQPAEGSFKAEEFLVCVACQREVSLDPKSPKCFPCYTHGSGIHCVEARKRPVERGAFIWNPAVRFLIFDEVHRCSGLDTLNADMLIAAKRQGIPILGLSATAACSPLQFRALGYALDLHTLVRDRQGNGLNFFTWAMRYGAKWDQRFHGWKWMVGKKRQVVAMAEIRRQIIPRAGVRVSIDDLPGFPECDIRAELYDLKEHDRLDECYHDMEMALKDLEDRARDDINPEHPLTKILRASERIELLKVPIAVDLANDYVDKGFSVAIFVNYRATLKELLKRLDTDCFVDGSPEGVRDRWTHIDRFQADKRRKIVVNSKAGGVCISLHDIRGEFPRVGLMMPCYSATVFRQVTGRLRRDGGKSKSHYRVMFVANSVEEPQHRALSLKLDNLDALNDEDLSPGNLRLTKAVLEAL